MLALAAHLGTLPLAVVHHVGGGFIHKRTPGNLPCQATDALFCPQWAADNLHMYVSPALKQAYLVVVSVGIGFVLALALALVSHRRRWLVPPVTGATGVLFTIPSLAFFALLIPITGFGTLTAVIPLSVYTLQIIYRNIIAGLASVPQAAKDAGRGMGMTPRQLLWKVELPLAVPEIIAGLRVATVSTVALATLAFVAGAGGLGELIKDDLTFKTNILIAGGLAILIAVTFDMLLLAAQRLVAPWQRARRA